MNSAALKNADACLASALRALRSHHPSAEYLRTQLLDVREHIGALADHRATRGDSAQLASIRTAIKAAVESLRHAPARLSVPETVILSKLMVLQSVLCTPRFDALD